MSAALDKSRVLRIPGTQDARLLTDSATLGLNDATLESLFWKYSRHSERAHSVTFDLTPFSFLELSAAARLFAWAVHLKKYVRVPYVAVLSQTTEQSRRRFLTDYLAAAFEAHGIAFETGPGDQSHLPEHLPTLTPSHAASGVSRLPLLLLAPSHVTDFADQVTAAANLPELATLPAVRSGELTSIVLLELLRNIEHHGGNRTPYLMLTRLSAPRDPSALRHVLRLRSRRGTSWERTFVSALSLLPDCRFLTVAIGDLGPGIPTTLRESPHFSRTAPDMLLLREAFDWGVSRRPLDWDSLLKPTPDKDPLLLGMGLFLVRRVMQRARGLLVVRSGTAAVAFDFLSDPSEGAPNGQTLSHQTGSHRRTLRQFPGTHFALHFPLTPPAFDGYHAAPPHRSRLPLPTATGPAASVSLFPAPATWRVVRLRTSSATSRVGALRDLWGQLRQALEAAEPRGTAPDTGPRIVVHFLVDASDSSPITHGFVHYLSMVLSQRQSPRRLHLLSGVPDLLIDTTGVDSFRHVWARAGLEGAEAPRLVPILTTSGRLHLLGGTSSDSVAASDIISASKTSRPQFNRARLPSEILRLFASNDHLFAESSTAELEAISYLDMISSYRNALAEQLSHYLLHPDVFQPDRKVRLRDRYFVRGYFEVSKLRGNMVFCQLAASWASLLVRQLDIDGLVAVGSTAAAISHLLPLERSQIVEVPAPLSDLPRLRLHQLHARRVLFLVDILGSGHTLRRVAGFLSSPSWEATAVLVDATSPALRSEAAAPHHDGAKPPARYSLVRHELAYSVPSMPGDWTYDDLSFVNPVTGDLVPATTTVAGEALWYDLSRLRPAADIENRSRPREAQTLALNTLLDCSFHGHFRGANGRHLSIAFDIPALSEQCGSSIADAIDSDWCEFLEIGHEAQRVTRDATTLIIFPEYNPGVSSIARSLSARAPSRSLVPFSSLTGGISDARAAESARSSCQKVIVLDDAILSGATIRQLVDEAYELGARLIGVYTILNRGSASDRTHLSRQCAYGATGHTAMLRTRWLVAASLPSYNPTACAICRLSQRLVDVASFVAVAEPSNYPTHMEQTIRAEVAELSVVPVEGLAPQLRETPEGDAVPPGITVQLRALLEHVPTSFDDAAESLRRLLSGSVANARAAGIACVKIMWTEAELFFQRRQASYRRLTRDHADLRETLVATFCEIVSRSQQSPTLLGKTLVVWSCLDYESLLRHLPAILGAQRREPALLESSMAYLLVSVSLGGVAYQRRLREVLIPFQAVLVQDSLRAQEFVLRRTLQIFKRFDPNLEPPIEFRWYVQAVSGPYVLSVQLDYFRAYNTAPDGPGRNVEEAILKLAENMKAGSLLASSNLLTDSERSVMRSIVREWASFLAMRREDGGQVAFAAAASSVSAAERVFVMARRLAQAASVLSSDIVQTAGEVYESDQRVRKLRDFGMKISFEFERPSIYVFMRRSDMAVVLAELLSNLRHLDPVLCSEGDPALAKIDVTSSSSGEYVSFALYDKGESGTLGKWGRGLELIRSATERYGGIFVGPCIVDPRSEAWNRGYRKFFSLSLLASPGDMGDLTIPGESSGRGEMAAVAD